MHWNGAVDVPFPRSIRDLLLDARLAEGHRWIPDTGWITFDLRNEEHVEHAAWLLRLSYLRHALKTASHPRELFEEESAALQLGPELRSLLEGFIPATATIA